MAKLSANAFALLIAHLDRDPIAAADRYEKLRLKLIRCLAWKGVPESQADALADIVIDRVAMKLEAGEVVKNIDAFACTVMRFVYLEYTRRIESKTGGEILEIGVDPEPFAGEDPDERMNCLRKCLVEVVPNQRDREIIVAYYDNDPGLKNKEHRKNLAARFGLTAGSLKVRARGSETGLKCALTTACEPP